MGKSQRVRLRDVRDICRVVGECEESWADPSVWWAHLLREACRLTGAQVGVGFELRGVVPECSPEVLAAADLGWADSESRRFYVESMAGRGLTIQPCYPDLIRAFRNRRCVTFLREQLMSDRDWYVSEMFNDYARHGRTDHYVVSLHRLEEPGVVSLLNVNRMLNEPPLGGRERRVIDLLHAELAPRIGTRLATWRHRGLHGLSPRQRQTLDRLLEGDGEKQIAYRLGLSRSTVHEYITAVYRHFGVSGRGELLAYFLRRRPEVCEGAAPPGVR